MDRKLSVLYIAHTEFMGGASAALLEMIEELSSCNVVPIVLVLKPTLRTHNYKSTLTDECLKRNIKCFEKRYFWFKQSCLKRKLLCFLNLFLLIPILLLLRKQRFDIIHSNSSVVDIGALLSYVKKVPHVWHFREFGYEFGLTSVFGNKYETYIYSKSAAIITISPIMQKYYYSRLTDPTKLHLVWDGVAIPKNLVPSRHNNGRLELCIVGMVTEAKNQLEVVKALNVIVNKMGRTKIHLTIIGENRSEYYHSIDRYIVEHNLSSYINFTGNVSNVQDFLRNMDIGLMVSKSEGFGRVTVEYMYYNLAVIVSDAGASPEIVDKCGIIYPLGNINALVNAIIKLDDDRDLMLNLAIQGQRRALSNFSSKTNAESVLKIYKSLISC